MTDEASWPHTHKDSTGRRVAHVHPYADEEHPARPPHRVVEASESLAATRRALALLARDWLPLLRDGLGALPSIAASLEKLANPPMLVGEDDGRTVRLDPPPDGHRWLTVSLPIPVGLEVPGDEVTPLVTEAVERLLAAERLRRADATTSEEPDTPTYTIRVNVRPAAGVMHGWPVSLPGVSAWLPCCNVAVLHGVRYMAAVDDDDVTCTGEPGEAR